MMVSLGPLCPIATELCGGSGSSCQSRSTTLDDPLRECPREDFPRVALNLQGKFMPIPILRCEVYYRTLLPPLARYDWVIFPGCLPYSATQKNDDRGKWLTPPDRPWLPVKKEGAVVDLFLTPQHQLTNFSRYKHPLRRPYLI
ncbi:hypothetical protein N657DRAFT_76706 [Parathielavia appendiculata]|uniref:Uncharacterized protein n=1 Tax=Parathielavia appendiculata TaxID=2587402 RepID=A0AAN6UD95_9PEZI|nr:hypothetical protein N657DRAFT_76706 [Parathielavia appendiculata]